MMEAMWLKVVLVSVVSILLTSELTSSISMMFWN